MAGATISVALRHCDFFYKI